MNSESTCDTHLSESLKSGNVLTNVLTEQTQTTDTSGKLIKGIDSISIQQIIPNRTEMQQLSHSIIGSQNISNQSQSQPPQLIICGNQQDSNIIAHQNAKRIKTIQQRTQMNSLPNQSSRISGPTQVLLKEGMSNNPNDNLNVAHVLQGRPR